MCLPVFQNCWTDFNGIWYCWVFLKYVDTYQLFVKIWHLHIKTYKLLWARKLLGWESPRGISLTKWRPRNQSAIIDREMRQEWRLQTILTSLAPFGKVKRSCFDGTSSAPTFQRL
jgi:hypothetical protein